MQSRDSSPSHDEFLARTTEATIRIAVVVLLTALCFQITRPFIIPAVWGIILATAVYPAFRRLESAIGGRTRTAAALLSLIALAVLIVPTVMFAGSFVESAQWLGAGLGEGRLEVPPPPAAVASWPLIGEPVHRFWSLASQNLEAAIQQLGPRLLDLGRGLLSAAAGAGLGVLQFLLSIVIAGVLLTGATRGQLAAQAISTRLAGERGPEFADLAAASVRSVAVGILGVALIQSLLIAIGLVVVGVPHASLWALLCLMLAVVQLPTLLVVLPIIVWVFSVESTPIAVLFAIWMVLAGGSDNVLKPILLSRGLDLPMVVIFMGAIGGFMSSGFIGLFVGAIVLALGYRLFMAWLGAAPGASGSPPRALDPAPDPAAGGS